jgi:hypothetical protein
MICTLRQVLIVFGNLNKENWTGHLARNGDRKIHRRLWLKTLKIAITYATDFTPYNLQVKLSFLSETV